MELCCRQLFHAVQSNQSQKISQEIEEILEHCQQISNKYVLTERIKVLNRLFGRLTTDRETNSKPIRQSKIGTKIISIFIEKKPIFFSFRIPMREKVEHDFRTNVEKSPIESPIHGEDQKERLPSIDDGW